MKPHQIRSLRKQLDLTQASFAEELGLIGKRRNVSVHRLETGQRKPGPQTIKIMRALAAEHGIHIGR